MPLKRRRFRRRPPRSFLVLVLIAAVVAVRWGYDRLSPPAETFDPVLLREGPCEVVRVVDGDTLIVRQHPADSDSQPSPAEARVRLIGIDTPESVKPNHPVEPWSLEATEFTKSFLSAGEVHLRLDKRRVDRYGRVLAYVYVGDACLNEELVRAGLARVTARPEDWQTMVRRLKRAEDEAREAERGIWSSDDR